MDKKSENINEITIDRKESSSHLSILSKSDRRLSWDSCKSSLISFTMSLPGSDSGEESIGPQSIVLKNKHITEILTARITALMFFVDAVLKDPFENMKPTVTELESVKNSLHEQMKHFESPSGRMDVELTLQKITDLLAVYKNETLELEASKKLVTELEDEENALNKKLRNIEDQVSRLFNSDENLLSYCQCVVI